MTVQQAAEGARRRSFVAGSVYVFEHIMPDPSVLAIGLTFLVALAAALFALNGFVSVILDSWYAGVFNILGFAFQMILILATGHALAHAPVVQREQVANMLQPFWALPVVAMAGIGIQRVLGFTAVTFFVAGLIYAAGLLLLT